jgi:hypothetical protein
VNKSAATLIVPKGSIPAYQANVAWQGFGTYLEIPIITLSKEEITIAVNKQTLLTALIDQQGLDIVWKSNNERVAIVSANGTIIAFKTGTATISATTENGAVNGECLVTVIRGDYDLSAVTFADKTATYNGEAYSILIGGSLPTGVSLFGYSGNGQTQAGEHTVTATFTVDDEDNYNVPAPKTA